MTPAANSNSKHHDLKTAYPLRQKKHTIARREITGKLPAAYRQGSIDNIAGNCRTLREIGGSVAWLPRSLLLCKVRDTVNL